MFPIAEVAAVLTKGDRLKFVLAEWLDHFYRGAQSERAAMIELAPATTGNAVYDAYLAAVVEHLAGLAGLPMPAWTQASSRFLKEPHFPDSVGDLLKPILCEESPAAFRRRNIFVSANAIERATTPDEWRSKIGAYPFADRKVR
ncbi:MAG: hypothetical protein ACLQAT_27025 [Candidatus Binataceae bacterium]